MEGVLVAKGRTQGAEDMAKPSLGMPPIRTADGCVKRLRTAQRLEWHTTFRHDVCKVLVGRKRHLVTAIVQLEGEPEHRKHVSGAPEGRTDESHRPQFLGRKGTIAVEVYEMANHMTGLWIAFVHGAVAIFATVLIACAGTASAGEAADSPGTARASNYPDPDPTEKPEGSFNIPRDTTGGTQFWTDFVIRGGWRIQRNEMTGHYRLLDEKNIRQGWGNYAFCLRELDRLMPTDPQAADRRHVVVLLHGLGRSRTCWDALAPRLERDGYRVVPFGYASTRGTLSDHAFALDHVLRHLERCERVSFVGHSLGNLVVRRSLDEHSALLPGEPKRERMVMLGPPNLGAQMARRMKGSRLFGLVAGAAGEQLSDRWRDVEPHLATPDFEFGVLAGGADLAVTNPLIDGENDLIVSVEETRLPGASDFRHVGAGHTFMPENDEVIILTLHFLKTGCFETPELRQPIEAPVDP